MLAKFSPKMVNLLYAMSVVRTIGAVIALYTRQKRRRKRRKKPPQQLVPQM